MTVNDQYTYSYLPLNHLLPDSPYKKSRELALEQALRFHSTKSFLTTTEVEKGASIDDVLDTARKIENYLNEPFTDEKPA